MQKTTLKQSEFVHVFKRNNEVALFHSLRMKKIYGNVSLSRIFNEFSKPVDPAIVVCSKKENLRTQVELINRLWKLGFLIDGSDNEFTVISRIRKRISSSPQISQLYLAITDSCNFRCRYCRSRNWPDDHQHSFMTKQTAQDSIDLFAKMQTLGSRNKGIVFYGGEPLLNAPVLEFAVKYARKLEADGAFADPLDINIFTNGTSIKPRLAKFLANSSVFVILSLDGRKKSNDRMRIDRYGKGTFERALKGYQTYTKAGCRIGISCVVGSHNIDTLTHEAKYFIEELKPANIGLNMLHDRVGNPAYVDEKQAAKQILNAFLVARNEGLYIEQVMRKVRVFVEEKVKLKDCPACGSRLVVAPNGKIGPCEGSLGYQEFFHEKNTEPSRIFKDWAKRSPFNMSQCWSCSAIGLCGGGCPFDAYVTHGDLWALDERCCVLSKQVLEWCIWELHDIVKNQRNLSKMDFAEPTPKERMMLYGLIRPNSSEFPLQSSSLFGESKVNSEIIKGKKLDCTKEETVWRN